VESVVVLEALQDEVGRITRSVGLLIQALPVDGVAEPIGLQKERDRLQDGVLYEALQSGDHWIDRVLASLGVVERTELEEKPVGWFCQCNDNRVRAVLMATGVDELSDMIAKEGHAEIYCDFCRKRYFFERPELVHLRDLAVSAALAHPDPSDGGDN
jgi:molecular chaperone Hsp33